MAKKVLITIFLFFCYCFSCKSQDIIIDTSGAKIFCKILKIDSTSIKYGIVRNNQFLNTEIPRGQVKSYNIATGNTKTKKSESQKSDKEKRDVILISFSGGYTIPLNDFASKDLTKKEAGLANEGYEFDFSATLKFSDYFGLQIFYWQQTHPFDDVVLRNYLNAYYNNNTFKSSSDPWKINGLLGGLYFSFPIKTIPKLSISVITLGGFPKYTYPSVTIYGYPIPNVYVYSKQEHTKVRAGSFLGDLSFSYSVKKQFALSVSINYLTGHPYFTNISSITTGSYGSSTGLSNYDQKVNTLTIKGGITYKIFS